MVFYLSMLAIMFLVGVQTTNHTKNITEKGLVKRDFIGNTKVFMMFLVLAFVVAFRYHVGTDYGNYEYGYPIFRDRWLDYVKDFEEPGIAVIVKLGSLIYDDPLIMFVLCAIITVGLYVKTICDYNQNYMYAMLLYVLIGCWHGSFNAMRQYLAAAVLFAGHRLIYERKLWKYVLVILIAMCFHRTALIMLPIYFVVNRNISFKNIVMALSVVVIVDIGYERIFSIMSDFKGTDQTQFSYMNTEVNIFRILVAFAPVVIAYFIKRSYDIVPEDFDFYYMLVIVNACMMLATRSSAYLARAGVYTEIYVAMFMSRLRDAFGDSMKHIFTLVTIALYLAYFLYEIDARGISDFVWIFGQI